MSRNILLVVFLALCGVFAIYKISENTPIPEQDPKKVYPVTVGMYAYSEKLAKLGTVSKVIPGNVGTRIEIESHGLLTHGVREVSPQQYEVVSRYVVVKMSRPQFRTLPRIDKKRR